MGSLAQSLKWRVIQTLFKVVLYFKRSRVLGRDVFPEIRKRYPSGKAGHKLYQSRIFLPKRLPADHDPLPLLIDVHGGAFIVNTPAIDDRVCRYLADHAMCCVVSVDYRKAPQNPFPAGYNDVVAQIQGVLADTELPVDRSKVFLFGSSAGGNLVLAAAQDKRIRHHITGVIGLYAVTDGSTPVTEKLKFRPNPDIPDILGPGYEEILDLYTRGSGASLRDVRISPGLYEKREDVPEHVFLIGAENDLLSHEAQVMAERLAGDAPRVPEEHGWRAGSVRWANAPGQSHGFDLFGPQGEKKEQKAKRLQVREQTYRAMADWLLEITGRSDGVMSERKSSEAKEEV